MLESLMGTGEESVLTVTNSLIVLGVAVILGLVVSLVYMRTHKKEGYVPSFVVTLLVLPVVIAVIIFLVGNNVARAFSLAGAFSIIRFRTTFSDTKDITYIFITLAVGLACGTGYITYAVLVTAIICMLMLVLNLIHYAVPKIPFMQLKISVPEDMNHEEGFNDIFEEYTLSFNMDKVKTREFGALFEVIYKIKLKPEKNKKEFIDALRCRNGNLNIVLTVSGQEERVYA